MWVLLSALALAAPVTFQVNDALVKDRPVEGVAVRAATGGGEAVPIGTTDAAGRVVADLAPGTWAVSYAHAGYVPIGSTPTTIAPEGGTITVALSPLLEATGDAGHRRVQIVLTWGSDWTDVPDCDAHLVCADGYEVYFGDRDHVAGGHEVRLDVDDVDWGGPETITLIDPPPGRYEYYVRNFAGSNYHLGASDVVVRVVLDDTPAGEFHVPEDLDAEDWLPFAALVVESDGRSRVEPFTPEQVAGGLDRRSRSIFNAGCNGTNLCLGVIVFPFLGALAAAAMILVRRLR